MPEVHTTNRTTSPVISAQTLSGSGCGEEGIALIPCGDAAAVAAGVHEHLAAGADHVCVQVVADMHAFPLDEYRELAPALLGRWGPYTSVDRIDLQCG